MAHKKNRELVFGVNSVTSYLEVSPERILQAFVLKGREDDKRIAPLLNRLYDNGLSVQLCQKRFLDEKTEGAVHQGIVLEVRPYEIADEHDLEALLDGQPKDREWLFLVLDGVTDPHNIGAALRSAWAAGCDGMIVPRDRSATLTATARKIASGGADHVPFFAVTNLARVLDLLKDRFITIVGLDGAAEDFIYSAPFTASCALVMGSEESGMRRLTRDKCDRIVKIPMAEGVESLNVSVAAGIALFEAVRQRRAV